MFDRRFTWDQISDVASQYILANCSHFVSSDSAVMESYESEVFDYVREQAGKLVPFICVEKAQKIIARDIAANACKAASSAAGLKDFSTARREMTEATNAIFRLALKEPLYGMLADTFAPHLKLIKSAPNMLTPEEQTVLAAASFALRNKVVNSGLVKP